MTDLVVVFFACAGAAWALVAVVRRAALRHAVLDVPNERSSHRIPTPRGGGVALVVCAAGAWGVGCAVGGVEPRAALGVALPALAIAALGGLDDIRTLGAGWRLVVQLGAAVVALAAVGGWPVVEVPGMGTVPLGAWGGVLAVVWMVGLTNAYNFMDGIDGIAGLQAVVAGVAWAVVGALGAGALAGWTGAAVAGAAVGFLVHNWSPARIFMGDVGSAFLGFVFAALALGLEDPEIPLAALAFVWPFVFDSTITFVRRLVRGERVWEAHRSHLYQRLVIAGSSHRRVATLYGALAALSAAGGVAWWAGAGALPWAAALAVTPPVLLGAVARRERAVRSHRETTPPA